MSQTLTDLLVHIIFSTKNRRPLISEELGKELHAYVAGIVRNLNGRALIVNGVADHIHMLLEIPPSICTWDLVRSIKANSSRWIHERSRNRRFAWQSGYGAFSVSRSNVDAVRRYIADQKAHHSKRRFEDEFLAFLKKHRVQYDENYIWK